VVLFLPVGPRSLKTDLHSYSPRRPLLQGVHAPSSDSMPLSFCRFKGRGCGGKNPVAYSRAPERWEVIAP
jgi:hypothetical protein